MHRSSPNRLRHLDYLFSAMLLAGGLLHTVAGLLPSAKLAEPALRLWFTLGGIVPILTGLANLDRARSGASISRLNLALCVVGNLAFSAACVRVASHWSAWASPQIIWFLVALAGSLAFTARDLLFVRRGVAPSESS